MQSAILPLAPAVPALTPGWRDPHRVSCKDVPGGAAPAFRQAEAALVAASHSWFDAPVAGRGQDAAASRGVRRGTAQGR